MSEPDTDTNPQKTMGVTMSLLAWTILLALVALAFDEWLGVRENPNREAAATISGGTRELALQRNHQHHYVVSGTINRMPVTFMVDTGATDVVVPEALARQLGLSKGYPSVARTANGDVTVYATVLEHIDIGGIELTHITASINPGMRDPLVLLGMSALRQIEFTQRGDKLILRQ